MSKKMNRKKLMIILATTTILAMLIFPMLVSQLAIAAVYDPNNMVVPGVLSSDTYELYPYQLSDLDIGFSKYGEMINGDAKVGLKYQGIDAFANPAVLEKDWSQGWFIDIHYVDLANTYKRAWAFALYTDLSGSQGIGGPWLEGCVNGPMGTPYGGRKTNVWATTDPIAVLYDGPRRFVALTNTTIYDSADKTSDDALVSVAITIIFNKVKKHVTLYKDIKRLDRGKFGRTFQVEFSNRGEWDIGTTSAPPAYGHFYDNLPTVYDGSYHEFYLYGQPLGYDVAQMYDTAGTTVGFAAFWPPLYGKLIDGTTHITRDTILSSLCTKERNQTWLALGSPSNRIISWASMGWPSADDYLVGLGLTDDEPMVFKNNYLLVGDGVDYMWFGGGSDYIIFTIEPQDTDYITFVWKHMENPGDDDMYPIEPDTPYVIGEWVFDLENEDHKRMFRCVTLYGLTDLNDGSDNNDASFLRNVDRIDSEVMYYLDECFNPYDLNDAVHKQTARRVQFYDGDGAEWTFPITSGIRYGTGTPTDYDEDRIETFDEFNSAMWTSYWFENWQDQYPDIALINYSPLQNHTPDKHWSVRMELDADATDERCSVRIVPEQLVSLATAYYNGISFESYVAAQTGGSPYDLAQMRFYLDSDGDLLWDEILIWAPTTTTMGAWVKSTLGPTSQVAQLGNSAENFENFIDGANTDGTRIDANNTILFIDMVIGGAAIWNGSVVYIDDVMLDGVTWNFENGRLSPESWDDYCTFAEKVLQIGDIPRDLQVPVRSQQFFSDYTMVWSGTQTDSFVGDGVSRTFVLSFETLMSGTEIVYVGEAAGSLLVQEAGVDYTINYAAGTVTFTVAPPAQSVVRVFYQYYPRVVFNVEDIPPVGDDNVKILYSTVEYENFKPMGKYEWIGVGKSAATVDSIGAAYMTEAFDSKKDIEVVATALDIRDPLYGTNVPYVMAGATTGTRTDYYYDYPQDNRSGLHDDWCTRIPVSSSNMLFTGGPRANLGTFYFDEWYMAMYAEWEYVVTDIGHKDKILALSCWDKQTYVSHNDFMGRNGYGTVSVYKDINGTIGFSIWGIDGQDTYYLTAWFWEYGIHWLQTVNDGVTDIIFEIWYPIFDPIHPIIFEAERLGTISEKPQHDCPPTRTQLGP
jgi:hypothetical protein